MNDLKQKSNICNFINGNLWKEKMKNYPDKIVIPYFLYLDSFEINNPLGSHISKQALTGVYYSFPTIPNHNLSNLDNIFVAMIFKSKDNKTYGNDACLHILVSKIIDNAENGIELNIDGKSAIISQCNDSKRTIENYKSDLIKNNVSETGISEESIFNTIPNFHVVNNYSVDIMHDAFEDVFHYN